MKIKFLSLSNLLILILTLFAWLFTVYKIEPFLHYHNQQIGFSTSYRYFKYYLSFPGGIGNYLAEFISQFFYFNIWGSFIIVLITSLQSLITLFIVTRFIGNTKLSFLVFAVILLFGVIVMYDYNYPYQISIKLLLAFISTLIFFLINDKYPKESVFAWPIMAISLLYIASGASLLVFSISTTFILILTKKKKTLIFLVPAILIFTAGIPYLAYKYVFPSNLMNLFRISDLKSAEMLSYNYSYQVYIYYLLLPAILLTVLFLNYTTQNIPNSNTNKRKETSTIRF